MPFPPHHTLMPPEPAPEPTAGQPFLVWATTAALFFMLIGAIPIGLSTLVFGQPGLTISAFAMAVVAILFYPAFLALRRLIGGHIP